MTVPITSSGISPRHPDAIGFLREFETQVDEYWFYKVCHIAITGDILDNDGMDELLALFSGNASFMHIQTSSVAANLTLPIGSGTDFLEIMFDFKNYKGLSETLRADFRRQVTIVFGANGSGKSSLCEAFKILANPDNPIGPLHNVKNNPPSVHPPQFSYKFRAEANPQTWTKALGFGTKSTLIKYFDATIAVRNVRDAIDPGRVVALAPFKLDIFDRISQMISRMKQAAEERRAIVKLALEGKLAGVNALFSDFRSSYFATVKVDSADRLSNEIAALKNLPDQAVLTQTKKIELQDVYSASSPAGLLLLKAQLGEVENICVDLQKIIGNIESSAALSPVEKKIFLEQAQSAQELLAMAVIPEGCTAMEFLPLLRAAAVLCNFQAAEGENCPLCKQPLENEQIGLFNKYYEVLTNEISAKISTLSQNISKAQEYYAAAKSVDWIRWASFATIAAEAVARIQELSETILGECEATMQVPPNIIKDFDALKAIRAELLQNATEKKRLIATAEAGENDLKDKAKILEEEIAVLEYGKLACQQLTELEEAAELNAQYIQWGESIGTLPGLQRGATFCSKDAYMALVLSGFESRLNDEYIALTERPMSSFGVTLSNEARQQALKITPVIGGQSIGNIFSEGEQRAHALALFFAELDTAPQKVIVFDDPSTSFDYNFVSGYCERIRDFVQAHADKQVIILSHHWEFFVQMQAVLNSATPSLNGRLDIQVLENASVLAEYNEDIASLKADIETVLQAAWEPSREEKERTAGKMRRLIESIVNIHVFARQRHQYKQKSQPVSQFSEFTKLTPLLNSEAQTLRDLYSKLSITEHDDPRNAYTVLAKAVFQSRYDDIKVIEAAIISRKP